MWPVTLLCIRNAMFSFQIQVGVGVGTDPGTVHVPMDLFSDLPPPTSPKTESSLFGDLPPATEVPTLGSKRVVDEAEDEAKSDNLKKKKTAG